MIGTAHRTNRTPPRAMLFQAVHESRSFAFVGFDEQGGPDSSGAEARACDERLRETHHRVKNNLQMIASMLAMQARQDSPSAKEALTLAANRIMAVAKLHEQLQSSGSYPLEAAAYLAEVCRSLAIGAGCEDRGVELKVSSVAAEVTGGEATALGLIVTELVTNALKHAFDERGGRIDIDLAGGFGWLALTVADTGRGLSPDADQGLGLTLVRQMAMKLGGALEIESAASGAAFRIRFPH